MQRFTRVAAWRRSHQFALGIYQLTAGFPPAERFGLVSQLRRAAVSVAANIAEGAKRRSNRAYEHFLNIAEGSLAECQYLLILARDLGYAKREELEVLMKLADDIAAMLHRLRQRVAAA